MKVESEVTQACPNLSNPMDCSLPGSSIHGIFQATVLEWGAIAFSKFPFGLTQNQLTSENHLRTNANNEVLERKKGEGNGTPLQYFCPESLMGGGAW